MNFTFETQYTAETMTAMAKVLRKTIRKKKNRWAHILGWAGIVLGVLVIVLNTASDGFTWNFHTVITFIPIPLILMVLFFEDKINGYIAKRCLLPGTERALAVFSEDDFTSVTAVGKSEWSYDNIIIIAETADFFMFIFSERHVQLYDKRHLQGGTTEGFRKFIERKTNKSMQLIK